MNFEVPSIKQRGQVAQAMAAVQEHRPEHGEATGRIRCTRCGGSIRFTIDCNGISRGLCVSNCGVRWVQ